MEEERGYDYEPGGSIKKWICRHSTGLTSQPCKTTQRWRDGGDKCGILKVWRCDSALEPFHWRPEVFELLAVILTLLALQIPLKVCNPAHVAEAPCLCITILQLKCVLWRIVLLLFQLEEVCPFVRRANRGFTMSSTSRRSTVTGTPSASGMLHQLNIPVINYAYLLKSRISTAGGLLGFTS